MKGDYMDIMFEDLKNLQNVRYISDPMEYYNYSKDIKILHKLHHDGRLNHFFSLPFKSIWSKYYFHNDFKDERPICFIFLMRWLIKGRGFFLEYLKHKYPNCKMIVYFEDLVNTKPIDLQLINKYIDFAISYDENEAQKYGFLYYPTPYSKKAINTQNNISYDLYFCGGAKNRYSTIVDTYKYITSFNIKSSFEVFRLPKKETKYKGINYISQMIPYEDYLKKVMIANCILEIMQTNALGYTLRTWDAIAYNKKLLTNNPQILTAPFYKKEQFCYFSKVEDIDTNFIKEPLPNDFHNEYISKLSPINLLQFIENKL